MNKYMMIAFSIYKMIPTNLQRVLLNSKMNNLQIIQLKTRHKVQTNHHLSKIKRPNKIKAVQQIKVQNKWIKPLWIQIKHKSKQTKQINNQIQLQIKQLNNLIPRGTNLLQIPKMSLQIILLKSMKTALPHRILVRLIQILPLLKIRVKSQTLLQIKMPQIFHRMRQSVILHRATLLRIKPKITQLHKIPRQSIKIKQMWTQVKTQ